MSEQKGLTDGHVHLENGPLTAEYVMQFADEACRKGISRLQILDHTHRFKEFAPLYESMMFLEPQRKWLEPKLRDSLEDYLALAEEMRNEKLPLEVSFGLEVCYFRQKEDFLRDVLPELPLDFCVGSVHEIFDIAYDCSWSMECLWKRVPADEIYREYYNNVFDCVRSGLFTQLGHPDTIKMYGIFPSYDLRPTYEELAGLLNEYKVLAENNTGAYYRYGYPEIGLSDELLGVFRRYGCGMVTASDAHKPKDCGNYIADIWDKTFC